MIVPFSTHVNSSSSVCFAKLIIVIQELLKSSLNISLEKYVRTDTRANVYKVICPPSKRR